MNQETLSRPNFFPGQWIDYHDFNRLSEQPERILGRICEHLFRGGGIIVDALAEFRVSPVKDLTVLIAPGVGLLPDGQLVYSPREIVVDLAPYRTAGRGELVISLTTELKGGDFYADDADPSIRGFRRSYLEPKVVVSAGAEPEALEIFRTRIAEDTEGLEMAGELEEWSRGAIAARGRAAVIDLRHRRTLVPQTYLPADPATLIEARRALYDLADGLRKTEKIYLTADPGGSENYLLLLHAELLARPFQPLKASFLLAEFATKLSLYLELVLNRAEASAKENFDKPTLLATIAVLETLRRRGVTPRGVDLAALGRVAETLGEFVRNAEVKFSLMDVVEEAMLDLTHRFVEFGDRQLLAGHLFRRVDAVTLEDERRITLRADNPQTRRISTQFKNGDKLALKGVFFGQGEVTCEIKVPNPSRPLILFARQYIRRAGAKLQYEINGKLVGQDTLDAHDLSNNWRNKGIVVRPEWLVQNTNLFKIKVDETDLDFGFFDLVAYQPAMESN